MLSWLQERSCSVWCWPRASWQTWGGALPVNPSSVCRSTLTAGEYSAKERHFCQCAIQRRVMTLASGSHLSASQHQTAGEYLAKKRGIRPPVCHIPAGDDPGQWVSALSASPRKQLENIWLRRDTFVPPRPPRCPTQRRVRTPASGSQLCLPLHADSWRIFG